MKAALVIEWLDAWRGGAETSTQQFIHRMIEQGVYLDVFTRSRLSSTPHMQVHTINASSLSRATQSMLFARRTAERIRRGRYDVVHAITPCDVADIYQPRGGTVAETVLRNLALRKAPGPRNLKRLANRLNLKQQMLLHLERRLFHPGGHCMVAAVSDYVARQLRQHYHVGSDRIRVIFNAVEPDRATPDQRMRHRQEIREMYRADDRDYVVLFMAHNFKLKGLATWIEAAAVLARETKLRLRSWIVGKDDPRRWQRMAERRNLLDCLQFVGPTRRAEAFRHAADVLVHPTYYDPCSRVVLEALASQLPCITSRFDGSSEIIEHGVSGMILDDPADAASLARYVRALADHTLRTRISHATAGVQDTINMRRHAAEMYGLYQEISNGALVR